MKSITFVRHAKSSWEYNLPDIERPLKQRGTTDAILVASHFKELKIAHDLVISSPAQRTLSTYDIFNHELDMESLPFNVIEQLYDFEGTSVNTVLTNLEDKFNAVMLFGHNFALTKLANQLSQSVIDHVPTSGLFRVEFDINSWCQLDKGKLTHFITPKQLK